MKGYKRKEFILRQVMCVFLALELCILIFLNMDRYFSTERIHFELIPIGRQVALLLLCVAAILLVAACCFSRRLYVLTELLHVPAAVYMLFKGYDKAEIIILLSLMLLRLTVYIIVFAAAKNADYRKHISAMVKEIGRSRNERH